MKVCEQTVKPRGRYFTEAHRKSLGLPADFSWYVSCGRFSGWGSTLGEALRTYRDNRLSHQLSGTRAFWRTE